MAAVGGVYRYKHNTRSCIVLILPGFRCLIVLDEFDGCDARLAGYNNVTICNDFERIA